MNKENASKLWKIIQEAGDKLVGKLPDHPNHPKGRNPYAHVAMIPMLAWIAKNAPAHLKATFFAVFASFTNLALSANALGTKYLNEIFVITREVKDKITGQIQSMADYSELGMLLIVVTLLTLIIPVITVLLIQKSKFKTNE